MEGQPDGIVLVGDAEDQVVVGVHPADDRPPGGPAGKGPVFGGEDLPVQLHGTLDVEAPGLGGIGRQHGLIVLPHVHMQPVLLQGQPVVGYALQIPEQLPVRDGQGTQRGIIIVRIVPGIVFRDPGIDRAHVAAAVDGQDTVRNFLRHGGGKLDVFLPVGGGFPDLPGGILHPQLDQVGTDAFDFEGFNPVFQRLAVVGHVGLVAEIIFPWGQNLSAQGGQGRHQAKQQQEQPKRLFFHGLSLLPVFSDILPRNGRKSK